MTSLLVKVVAPKLLVGFMAREHVEGTDHHRVGHRDDGPFLPPPRRQALVEGREAGPFRTCRGMGQLGQRRPQDAIPFAGLPRALFPGTFVIAGRDARSGGQTTGGAKAPHVGLPLRDQGLGPAAVDPGHGI
jgi:hypothetical protein